MFLTLKLMSMPIVPQIIAKKIYCQYCPPTGMVAKSNLEPKYPRHEIIISIVPDILWNTSPPIARENKASDCHGRRPSHDLKRSGSHYVGHAELNVQLNKADETCGYSPGSCLL